MYSEKDSPKLSNSLSDICKKLEYLRTKCISDQGTAEEIISDVLEQLHASIEAQSSAVEENKQQKEDLIAAKEALKERKNELRLDADGIPTLLANISADLHYLFVNRSYADWLGLPSSKIVGRHLSEILPEGVFKAALQDIKRVLSGEEVTSNLAVSIEGQQRYLNITFIPQFDESGAVVSYYSVAKDITDRNQAEKAINAERKQLLSIFGSINEGIYISDMDTYEILYANKAMQRSFGQELVGELCYKALQGKDKPCDFCTNPIIRKLNCQPYQWEFHNSTVNKDFQIVDRVINWPDGRYVRFELAIDITERKQVEEELRRSKDELERRVAKRTAELQKANVALGNSKDYLDTIINSISDPIHVKDRQHRLVLVNNAACKLFGHSRDDIIGKTAYDLFPTKEISDISWQKDEEVFLSRSENVNEETNTYAPGVTRTVLVKKTPFTDNNGNWLLVGITRDITEQKKAQEQIRFQAALLDQVHNTVIATDLDGNITYWNKFAEALLQWTSEEILGRNIAETIVPEGRLDRMRSVISGLITSSSCDGEFYLRKKDGSIVPAYQSFSTVKDDRGDIIGLVGVAVDITERKRAEDTLKSAKKDAEAAAKAKSEFLATMSHEIRTPMNAVIGLTELIQRTDLNKEQRDYIETIKSSGNSLLSIINNILDFSKIDSGKIELEVQPFSLRDCVEDSMDLVDTEASKKGLNLTYTIDTSAPGMIMGDPIRLRQILINLLSNAIKFTDQGEVMMAISGRKLEGDNHEIHFAIKDTGIGIPNESLGKLFQPFTQVDATTTRRYGGTGLGLAISKRLVEMIGGRIWAESEVGKGSTFHFTIIAAATTIKPTSSRTIASQPQTDLKLSQPPALRILLAEDNPVNRKVAMQMLRKIGYEADIAANGLEVLQALERHTYDIVLMDIQMPEMDGLEAAKNIRERWHNGPTIIAITAYALEGDRDRCLNVGMDDYISKPIQIDELRSKLIKWGTNSDGSKIYS